MVEISQGRTVFKLIAAASQNIVDGSDAPLFVKILLVPFMVSHGDDYKLRLHDTDNMSSLSTRSILIDL